MSASETPPPEGLPSHHRLSVVPPAGAAVPNPAPPRPTPAPATPAAPAIVPAAPAIVPAAPGPAPAPVGKPLAAVPKAQPPARPSRVRRRHKGIIAAFLGFVLAPLVVSVWYLWAVAADQYASTLGFSVHREDMSSAISLISGLSSLSGSSSADTDIIYRYIYSQQVVAEIQDELDLVSMWSRPGWDPVFAFHKGGSIEDLTYAFSFVFREPPIGTNFQLFYATGMLPFLMFTMITNRVGAALVFSRQLLVYPAVTFLDAIIARFLVNALTQVLVFYVVMTGIMLIYDTRAILDFSAIGASLVLTAVFGFAMGTLNAYLFMRFKLWHVAWSLISRPLFLLSGVIFMYDALPGQLKTFLWYNPLVHIVGVMRRGFYPSYVGDYISPLYVVGVSLALTLIGLRMLSWHAAILIHEP